MTKHKKTVHKKPAVQAKSEMHKSTAARTPAGKARSQKPYKLNPWMWAVLALIVVAAGAFIFTQLDGNAVQTTTLPREVSVARAAELRDGGAFMLDVREQSEWDEFHMPGATLIPLGELESRVSELPKDQEIVVVCRSGNRSQAGRDVLLAAGFADVTSMAGGMNQWRSQGLPTVTGP